MPNKLETIVLLTCGYEIPRATFIRYRGLVRLPRVYRLNEKRWAMLDRIRVQFEAVSMPGTFIWLSS